MTDQLKELANECKERGIDFDDVSPNQGSTSCDKLVRHYIAAASPDVVLALIAEVERLKSQEPVAYVVSIGNSPISITCPVKHLDLLAKSHNAPLYLASGAAPTRPTTPEQQAEPVQERITHITWDERGVRTVNGIPDDAPQRPWVGLTEADWEWVADKKETSLDTFAHGAAWAADQLKERNT